MHLQAGPIDVVLEAWGQADAVEAALAAAEARFPVILPELCAELPELRRPMADRPRLLGPVARRMAAACTPFAPIFVTPMAAVAGAVADALLATMLAAAPTLTRAFVNDGGDIVAHVAPGERLRIGLIPDPTSPTRDAEIELTTPAGVATSGRHGRSFSLGIADAVTVLAADAATADVAATLIANAVDIADPAITRAPARSLDPDSDLGERLVTTGVGPLGVDQVAAALAAGVARAEAFLAAGLIRAAALRLRGQIRIVGPPLLLQGPPPCPTP